MKPVLLKITAGPAISFSARSDHYSYKHNSWHYHPEFEFIHVIEGAGMLFAGDGIHHFKGGDLICIGSYLPHYWKFDQQYIQEPTAKSYIELTQFREDFWGKDFLTIPENQKLAFLLEKCKKGLVFNGKQSAEAKKIIIRIN